MCHNKSEASIKSLNFKHTAKRDGAEYMHINNEGICDACKHAEEKEKINWNIREEELLKLLDKYRKIMENTTVLFLAVVEKIVVSNRIYLKLSMV